MISKIFSNILCGTMSNDVFELGDDQLDMLEVFLDDFNA